MAIKKVAILVTIDTGEQSQSCYSGRSDKFPKGHNRLSVPGADETYVVGIHNSNANRTHNFMEMPNRDEMLDCAAHELGHVLSAVFEYPEGMMNDPRQLGELPYPWSTPNPEQKKRMIANEALAWKLAEKVRPNLDRDGAAKDLKSYTDNPHELDMNEIDTELAKMDPSKRKAAGAAVKGLRDLLNSDKMAKLLAEDAD